MLIYTETARPWFTCPPDGEYGLWYHEDINRFKNEDGEILHDLADLFDVWELEEWKKTKEFGIMISKNGFICEFYYIPATTKGE